jgi:hypothetical protein
MIPDTIVRDFGCNVFPSIYCQTKVILMGDEPKSSDITQLGQGVSFLPQFIFQRSS